MVKKQKRIPLVIRLFLSFAGISAFVLVLFFLFGQKKSLAGTFVIQSGKAKEARMVIFEDQVLPYVCALGLQAFVAFPEANMVFREGEKAIEAPEPKYSDRTYLDVNLQKTVITLFHNGKPEAMYKIAAFGNPRTAPTPKGEFTVLKKEENHFVKSINMWMPFAMQVKGDYFIHGWPYYPDGTLYKGKYSRGCVRVPTEKQKELFERISVGTTVVIY